MPDPTGGVQMRNSISVSNSDRWPKRLRLTHTRTTNMSDEDLMAEVQSLRHKLAQVEAEKALSIPGEANIFVPGRVCLFGVRKRFFPLPTRTVKKKKEKNV